MSKNLANGKRLYALKRYDMALKEFKALKLDPASNMELSYYMGLVLTQLKDYEQAALFFEQVVASDYSFFHVYQCRMILAYIYAVSGRLRLSEYEFLKTIDGGIESRQVFAGLGHVFYLQKRIDLAVENLEKALRIDGKYATAQNSLGFILAEEEIDPGRAVELCKKALGSRPNNPVYLDSLGWAEYKCGRPLEARSYLRKALDMAPRNKEIAAHLRQVMSGL
ncbi:MAG: tetratricopeptide repeat protein [Spirochaetales bacterium]|nr:tetratricopeptide repeat protein [Spirochaetales bacterium]